MTGGRTFQVAGDVDVAAAAREARGLAEACGLSSVEAQHVATAVSEVARNAVKYAGGGEVELAPAERDGRRGLRVTVRDRGPGIPDVGAALRDGMSTSGSLGLGLPGARRLMDDFAIRSGPDGTEVAMARWEGGLLATDGPATCMVVPGPGGVAIAQPFRNGLLLGVAAGARADAVTGAWSARPWRSPAQLADAARGALDHGERLGVALASISALDGRLAWLRAGAVECVLLRGHRTVGGGAVEGDAIVLAPRRGIALSRAREGALRAATVDVRRGDVLVMAAVALEPAALAELARDGAGPGAPAFLTARFDRGALEPRRPAGGVEARSTLEGP
jgi:serine/threonine-protein kinase RsbT